MQVHVLVLDQGDGFQAAANRDDLTIMDDLLRRRGDSPAECRDQVVESRKLCSGKACFFQPRTVVQVVHAPGQKGVYPIALGRELGGIGRFASIPLQRHFHRLIAMHKALRDTHGFGFDVNAQAVAAYLKAQIDAGADAVMIFDTWGGVLGNAQYEPFSLAYSRKVIAALEGSRVPVILFTKGGGPWLEAITASGAHAIGLDWTFDPRAARTIAGGRVALQGNLDPAALFAPPERVRAAARDVLDAFGVAPGHVFNLGHGILTKTPIDSVAALVDEVRAYSARLRAKEAPRA